jgi:hypothetical protein
MDLPVAEVELDVDRVARITMGVNVPGEVVVLEDMHYPLEPERRRPATEEEIQEIGRLMRAGKFRMLAPAKI